MTGGILMRKILHRFNMVEIVLAIGVVAIGVTGVMALLPPALNANRDVAVDAFVDEAASKMQAIFKLKYVPEWSSAITALETNPPDSTTYPADNDFKTTEVVSGWKIYEKNTGNDAYKFLSSDGITSVHARVWKGKIDDLNGISSQPSITDAARIFVEFSWPTTATSNRQTRLIAFDVFKPQ